MAEEIRNKDDLDGLVKSFWETFPPIWHATRSLTHQTATEEFGITAAQFHTLRRIKEGKASVSALAECMHLSRPNISRTVDELVNAGMVARAQDAADRRNISLSLTPQGEELINNLLRAIGSKMKSRFSQLDQEEIRNIQTALGLLRNIFTKQEKP
jgi:DNA-binding MarR family transcriptional regulator